MRILYGVHGYGRGHATRSEAVLPALKQHHQIKSKFHESFMKTGKSPKVRHFKPWGYF